ncbi:oxygen-dependent coproporphyrinogen-III oxidase-like [Symsagittifera roscoffensis]|uniref:oxygen-dependent coproporphyrinogen-III oxidase-like n=1 Tax=Symsagittifera roscoffensis TaxID=84072 RepID=UPI00307BC0F5
MLELNFQLAMRISLYLASSFSLGSALSYKRLTKRSSETQVHCKSANPEKFMALPVTNYDELRRNTKSMKHKMELFLMRSQRDFCNALAEHEPEANWRVDKWDRKSGGGGISCVMHEGKVLEKAGVNISVVHGVLPEKAVESMNSRGKQIAKAPAPFFACGISSVIHPRNPYVPTIHFNYRYFEVDDGNGNILSWFGGGTDLTPYYLNEEDAVFFHQMLKGALKKHGSDLYRRFKQWCDTYFYLPHRGETRGVGGIFFDDMNLSDADETFALIKDCADATIKSYIPMVDKHKNAGYGLAERNWQLLRRGRYVEFNLIYDRGTQFGLRTPDARIESILMSLPGTAKWEYMHEVKKGSEEEKLMDVLKNPVDWVPLD